MDFHFSQAGLQRRARNKIIFEDTLNKCRNDVILRKTVENAMKSQVFIPRDKPFQYYFRQLDIRSLYKDRELKITVTNESTMDAVDRIIKEGKDNEKYPLVLNFASYTNPGGGVTKGASAQEESICRVTSLYSCLSCAAMMEKFYLPHRREHEPLGSNDMIYTPDVVQIKKETDLGVVNFPNGHYNHFAVITCAAPNLRNIAEDDEITIKELTERIHTQRAKKILTTAVGLGHRNIILGAFGCGVFMNDPNIVAETWINVLMTDFKDYPINVVFAIWCKPGHEENYNAFRDAL